MSFSSKYPVCKISAVLLLLAAVAAPAAAALADPSAGALFVFHANSPQATVLDPATLGRVADAGAPVGAFRALARPRPNNSPGASNYYIIGPRSVTVLDSRFQEQASIPLPAVASRGSQQAVMSADGSRLAIIAGPRLLLIDAETNRLVANLDVGFTAAAILPHPDGRRALLPAPNAALGRWVDFDSDSLAPGAVLMPTDATAGGLSADGARSMWFGSDGFYSMADMDLPALHGDLDRMLRAASTPIAGLDGARPPVDLRLAVTDSGRFFLQRDGRLIHGRIGAAVETAEIALAGGRALRGLALWTPSRDGQALFAVLPGQPIVTRIDPTGLRPARTANLAAEPTAVELAAPRVLQQSGSLDLVTANGRTVAGNSRFRVEVQALTPDGAAQSGVAVFVTNVSPMAVTADCAPDVTGSDGVATLDCRLGDIEANTAVQLTISDDRGRNAPIASVNAIPPLLFEGLTKIEGDLQTLPGGTTFALRVQAAKDRLPQADVPLTVSVEPADGAVSCDLATSTGATGFATINCTTAEVEESDTFIITVESEDDAVQFSATVDPLASGPDGIVKISGDGQSTVQGTAFPQPLVVSSFRDGEPRVEVVLNVLFDPLGPITCPVNVLTNEEGVSSFRCGAKNVIFPPNQQATSAQVGVSDFGVQLQDPFVLTVTQSAVASVQSLEAITEDEESLPVNEPVIDAIQVGARSQNFPVQGVDVYFFSDDNITIDPPMTKTDGRGIASATVTIGCNPENNGEARVFFGQEPDEPEGSVLFTSTPGPFERIVKVQGDGQSGAPGQTLTGEALVARTTDICGATITNQPVTWRVLPEVAGRLRNVITRSNNVGLVSSLVTLGNYGGPFQVEVGNAIASATFDLAVELEAEQLRLRSGDGQMAGPGQTTTFPLVVDVLGLSGFGVAGVPVEFEVISGAAELVNATAETNGVGVAFTKVSSTTSGPIQVAARAVGQEVVFALNGEAGPSVSPEGVVGAASFQPGLVPGAGGTIFGRSLSNVEGVLAADSVPFPTHLGGVQVRVNGVPAPLIAVVNANGSEQVNFQTPFETEPGAATIEVDNNGMVSSVEGVNVSAVDPGIFEITIEGQRIAAALHQDNTLITPSSPARPGEVVQLFFTGGGALNPPVETNQPGPVDPLPLTGAQVVVGVDNVGQEVLAAFYAPTLVTAYQVNFVLNPATEAGDRVLNIGMSGVNSVPVTLPVGATAVAAREE